MGYLGRRPETLAGVTNLAANTASSIVNSNVGILSNLQTTIKSNVVSAINEIKPGTIRITVFANNTARDANITVPLAGMLVLSNTKFQGYDGNAWIDLN